MEIKEFNKDTVVVLPINSKGKYLFTVEGALAYIVKEKCSWFVKNMMIYNVPIRDAIRNHGIRDVADMLKGYVPESEEMEKELDLIVKYGIRLADFDIQVLPITAGLTFFGMRTNLKQLCRCTEIFRRIDQWSTERKHEDCALHVAELFEPYPCFDSFDCGNEDCNYVNYIIRDHKITEEYLMEIEDADKGFDCNFAVDSVPPEILPLVYRNGDDRFMYVATTKNNPQITPEELAKKVKKHSIQIL